MSEQSRPRAKSWEEIQPLVQMCWEGRLYDSQRWIETGKPMDPPVDMKVTKLRRAPVAVAIETGFHSLVELLVRSGCETDTASGTALTLAVRHGQPGIAHLLLDLGEDVGDASFGDVLTHKWDRTLVDRFIALGADTTTRNPLALAFRYGMRPALGVYMAYKDGFPQWKEQLGIALNHHIREGSPRWVALLIWAGADPHLRVQRDPWPGEYELKQSPMELAVSLGRVDLVEKFRVDASRDDVGGLVRKAAASCDAETLKRVLEQTGQPLQGHPSGTEVIAEFCDNCEFSLRCFPFRGLTDESVADGLCQMLSWGLKWRGGDSSQTRSVRQLLYRLPQQRVVQVVKAMIKHEAAPMRGIRSLLGTDKMLAHLWTRQGELQALWGKDERIGERAKLYFRTRDRKWREKGQRQDLKRQAREQALMGGPDGRLAVRILKALERRGPLSISRLAKASHSASVDDARRVLLRLRAIDKAECHGGGLAARWEKA